MACLSLDLGVKFAGDNSAGDGGITPRRPARALADERSSPPGRELGVGQPAVAKLERRADMYVSNLRRYIEALGGSLEITARFPEGSVNIVNFGELADTERS
jgi:hypothetical protein